ncbi:MAG: Grx4 family monothiol glutaredoxin [Alphaproteobacteria bacterium]|nr:Grx4 family monothiol glutaredoxin [Alphaproteobacteria bacterium]MDE2337140.1 Grx4 family monothiol glutaredoxin [Alphaproteobacteria bacterium]
MENALFERIRSDIAENDIVLYMKGSPVFPKDGYSAAVAEVLRGLDVAYCGIDVLEDRALYQAVKEFTNWPNVPQLYIKGEFVGGSDIVKELNASGELRALLEKHGLLDD